MKEILKLLIILVLATAAAVLIASRSNYIKNEERLQRSIVSGKVVPLDSKKKIDWCKQDKNCKALLITLYHEARSESDEGVIAVAQVVKNRASHPKRWKNTIHGVVHEKWQFSFLWDKNVDLRMKEKDQVERMAIISYDVISGKIGSTLASDALFYHTVSMKKYPSWSKKKTVVATIGNHTFYKF